MNTNDAARAAQNSALPVKQFLTAVCRVTYTDYLIEAADEDEAEDKFWGNEYAELGLKTIKISMEHCEVTSLEVLQYRDSTGAAGAVQ
jgi:hypothetical protein